MGELTGHTGSPFRMDIHESVALLAPSWSAKLRLVGHDVVRFLMIYRFQEDTQEAFRANSVCVC